MKVQPIEKMDAGMKLKMKFVFDVMDYIGEKFPIVVLDPLLGLGFNAVMTPDEEPALMIELARNYPCVIGNLKTGRLQKLEEKPIYTHLTITDRDEILGLKSFDKFNETFYKLLSLHHEQVREEVSKLMKVVSEKVERSQS